MRNLPYGMREDVEIEVRISGTAAEVLAELRALRPGRTRREAFVTAMTIRSDNRRYYDSYAFPAIVNGDAAATRHTADGLSRQGLIEAETERKFDGVINALETLTRQSV